MPLSLDWPDRARRVLLDDAAGSELTAGDLASQLEAALERYTSGPTRERLSLLIEYVVASEGESFSAPRARGALAWAAKTASKQFLASDIVPGWDSDLRALFDALAQRAPALLQEHRDAFSGHALEQIDFARALWGHAAWPEATMVAVARRYLNCPPNTFTYEGRIPTPVLSEAARSLLRQEAVPLLQWSRLAPMLSQADDELRCLFILNYCAQDFRSKAFELADASSPALIEQLATALDERQLSFSGAISAALLLTRAQGSSWTEEIPPKVRQALLWDLRCGNDVEATISLQAYAQMPERFAGELLRDCLREERALALIPAVKDDRVIADLLERIEKTGHVSDVAIDALVASGGRALEPLLAACAKKSVNASVAAVAAEVLGRSEHEARAEALVRLLGHSSKRVNGAAARSLSRMGECARAELETGTKATKKAVRAHCERLLAKLGNQGSDERTPLNRVRARAAELSAEERDAFLSLWREAGSSEATWQAKLRPEVQRLGALSVELLREWFSEKLEEGETRLWCYAVEELRSDPEAVWVAVDSFARMPKLSASLWARPRRALSHAGALLSAPIVHCLHNVHTEYRETLYGLLAAHADSADADIFLAGLSDPSKTVRTHSVDGLSRLSDGPLTAVANLLAGTEIGTRIAAAELLAVWGRNEVAPAIAAAWRDERSSKVKPYLEDALVACGQSALVFTLDEGATLDEDSIERFLLLQELPKKLPGFIHREQLPSLRYASGRELSVQAREGFLARLMMLDLTLKGRALRSTLPLLDADDVHAFGRWVYEGWARARNSKHKWAVLQLSLLADVELLHSALSQIGSFRGAEHTAINCHLRAAQWHPSEEAVQWLGYWAENLASLGARSTASQLLGRVAFKRRCSVQELRRGLIPFLGEELAERALDGEAAPGYPQQRQLDELERSWLSGRSWQGAALTRLFRTQPYLTGERLLLRSEAGRLCRLVPSQSDADGQLLDEQDAPLDPLGRFTLAHPLELTQAERDHWSVRLEAPAAIAQLERELYDLEALDELWGHDVAAELFSRFRRRNRWFHGEPMDAGIVYTDSLHLLGRGLVITLHHSGYGIGTVDFDDAVRLLSVEFSDLDGAATATEEVPAIVLSELCRSLVSLRQTE